MKTTFLKKVKVLAAIFTALILFIDGILFLRLSITRDINNLKESQIYKDFTSYPEITSSISTLSDKDKIPPVIVLSTTEFQTTQTEITLDIVASEELQQGEFEGYSIESRDSVGDESSYEYSVVISGFSEGENKTELEFVDTNGNVTSKSVNIKKKSVDSVSAYASSTEKIWPDGDNLLAVVDKEYALPADYAPSDLVYIYDYGVAGIYGNMQLREIVMDDLSRMLDDAKAEGHYLSSLSTYRSYQTQVTTYNYWLQALGQKEADRASARPGHSEHQLGTTIDFTCADVKYGVSSQFGDVPAGKWLSQNAYKYGFVMSYPRGSEAITGYKYEPWHYRYVGIENAKKIYESGKVPIVYLRELHFGIF